MAGAEFSTGECGQMKLEQRVMTKNGYKIFVGGVSLIGVDKEVNQDAFRARVDADRNLAYIIVADGLGSCRHSDHGAEKAVEIIEGWLLNRLPKYAFLSDNVANILAKRLAEEWNAAYGTDEIGDYDTTVHAAVFYKGSLLIGGIGDGMALIGGDELACRDYIDEKDMFCNVTHSMCSINVKELLDFEVLPETVYNGGAIMILATDGISEDLIPEKKLTLTAYFREVLSEKGIDGLQEELREWIENWETENHCDDKTICYLAVEKEERHGE